MSPAVIIGEGQQRLDALLPVLEKHQPFPNKRYPVRSNWASKLGHSCERYLYYMRHDWEKAEQRDWKGIGILGNLLAEQWLRARSAEGFKVIHQELALKDKIAKDYEIGGRIDCRIGWGDMKPMIAEIKSMNERDYATINTYEDLSNSKKDWIRGYPAQLQIYLLSEDEEAGLFILINKATLEWKAIPVYLDYGQTEYLLKLAERVNRANKAGVPLDRIPYGKTCQMCEFKTICLPDIINEGLDLIDNEHLEAILKERDSLEVPADRWLELDKEAKEIAKTVGKEFIVGTSYKCEFKKSIGTRIDTKKIPIEIASQYEVPIERVTITFVPLGK